MKIRWAQVHSPWRPLLQDIGQAAQQEGVRAFAVGGFVRDVLLRRPQLDLDVAVEGDAIRMAKRISRQWSGRVVTYPRFGTATVHAPDRPAVDFAMLRQEHYAHPGALPAVRPGTLDEDLYRRDFTINALAMGLHPAGERQVFDPHGGRDDVAAGVVRILHAQSFMDDPTRILRAVRFEQRFGFRMERTTLRCLREAIRQGAVETVKPPRYFQEFRKGLREAAGLDFLRRLHGLGGLAFLGLAGTPDWRALRRQAELSADAGTRANGLLAGLLCRQGEADYQRTSRTFGFSRREMSACVAARRPARCRPGQTTSGGR